MDVKVIIEIGRVPEGSTVTKLTGTKPYLVRDKIQVYGIKPYVSGEGIIAAGSGVRFLVDPSNGSANAIASDVEVVWSTTIDALSELQEELEGEDK